MRISGATWVRTGADLETVLTDPLKFVSGGMLSSRGKYLAFLDGLSGYHLIKNKKGPIRKGSGRLHETPRAPSVGM